MKSSLIVLFVVAFCAAVVQVVGIWQIEEVALWFKLAASFAVGLLAVALVLMSEA